jgi:hypothetical protein
MNRSSSRVWAAVSSAVVGLSLAGGCQEKPKPAPPPPPPPPALSASQQWSADVGGFEAALSKFDAHLADLPGHSESEHRVAAAAALADLTDAVRLAYGPNPAPGYANDVATIDAAAQAVAIPDVPHGRVVAQENQATHAATSALSTVAGRVLFDDAELPPLIDIATAKAEAARQSQGPLHDGDATDALTALDAVLHRVDADLQGRFAHPMAAGDPVAPIAPLPPSMPATTMPAATMPATSMPASTTLPVENPATMPATMPG